MMRRAERRAGSDVRPSQRRVIDGADSPAGSAPVSDRSAVSGSRTRRPSGARPDRISCHADTASIGPSPAITGASSARSVRLIGPPAPARGNPPPQAHVDRESSVADDADRFGGVFPLPPDTIGSALKRYRTVLLVDDPRNWRDHLHEHLARCAAREQLRGRKVLEAMAVSGNLAMDEDAVRDRRFPYGCRNLLDALNEDVTLAPHCSLLSLSNHSPRNRHSICGATCRHPCAGIARDDRIIAIEFHSGSATIVSLYCVDHVDSKRTI